MSGKNKIIKRWIIAGFLIIFLLVPTVTLGVSCLADIDEDGTVNENDSSLMQGEMGRDDCYTVPCLADLNRDGKVDDEDEEILNAEFGNKNCQMSEEDADTLKLDQKEYVDINEGETVSPPQTRFIDNKDGTVTDPKTGLMWTKDSNFFEETVLFHQALTCIDQMNSGEHSNFGYADWRLPTLEELRSLIDYTKLKGWKHEIPLGHPFQNVKSINFNGNNITTCVQSTKPQWFISGYCKLVGRNVRSCFGYVWPVRSIKQ